MTDFVPVDSRLVGALVPAFGVVCFGAIGWVLLRMTEQAWRPPPHRQIARDVTLSPKTVRNHVSTIVAKPQAADRAEAIIRAREGGMGQPGL